MAKTIHFDRLRELIEELTKVRPNQARVKKLMLSQGLRYSPDSIQQMSSVLTLMSNLSPGIHKTKSKEKAPEA